MRVKDKYKPSGPRKRLTAAQMFNLVRRLAIVAAALAFMYVELSAAAQAVVVLQTLASPVQSFGGHTSSVITSYLGSGPIRQSPLVMNVLEDDTSPRNSTVYLQTATQASFDMCEEVRNAPMYNNSYLRRGFSRFTTDTTYNLTFLADVELICPVVDCTFTAVSSGDISVLRVYNLVRSISNPDDVFVIAISLSVQEYQIPEQSRSGPSGVGTMTVVHDMSKARVEQFYFIALDYAYVARPSYDVFELIGASSTGGWELRSVPRDPTTTPVATVYTSRRRGFYLNAETDQSNIDSMYWEIEENDPAAALSEWNWRGAPAITDSWAWVHGIHFIFAMQTLFSTLVLFLIMVRNWRQGKIWIGDAFASLSNGTLITRAVIVLMSWHVNEYWTLTEFSLSNAYELAGVHTVSIHGEFVHADMLTLILGIVSVIGMVFKERIDPAFVIFLFEGIHSHRLSVIGYFPTVTHFLAKYARTEYLEGIATVTEIQAKITPLRLWTAHKITKIDFRFLLVSFFPKLLIISTVILYTIIRRIYHRFYPDQVLLHSGRSATRSTSTNENLIEKGNLTVFEIATGAVLRSRFGIISDYNNYLMIKGLKFASADGTYCSGYVIANGRFLVATGDIYAIALIKLLRVRLQNVYVYEVDGNSVQQTSRLVYPDTLTWKDLFRLNTSILS